MILRKYIRMAVDDIAQDRHLAEVFDALSHPTRIMILKALSNGAMGFANLKKKLGIENSGYLQPPNKKYVCPECNTARYSS